MKKHQTAILSAIILSLSAVAAFGLPQYTGFTARNTGYVVTATDWNNEFQNYINHVNTHCIGTLNQLLSKGRILSSDGTNISALTNSGASDDNKVLTLDSAHPLGLKWTTLPSTVIENLDAQGRLTSASGSPINLSGSVGATTIYYTPFRGNVIALYESSQWKKHTFSQITISLSGLTADKNYDVFIYDSDANDTADAADVVQWTDNTNRATALATQDGVYVKTGATSRRYVGTFRTFATGTTADYSQQRYIWNYYNRVDTVGSVGLSNDSWSYSGTTWRGINGSTTTSVDLVVGVIEDQIYVTNHAVSSGTGDGVIGIGIDSTTVNDADISSPRKNSASAEYEYQVATEDGYPPAIGKHSFYPLEKALTGTVTFYGDDGGNFQTGLIVKTRY